MSSANAQPTEVICEVAVTSGVFLSASADSLVFAPLAPDSAGLQEHQSQGQSCISATVAIATAHWILQQ